MKPILAKFLTSATDPKFFPPEGPPEFAFLGRSNVGKSSLINSLLGQKLAHVSSTPGAIAAPTNPHHGPAAGQGPATSEPTASPLISVAPKPAGYPSVQLDSSLFRTPGASLPGEPVPGGLYQRTASWRKLYLRI